MERKTQILVIRTASEAPENRRTTVSLGLLASPPGIHVSGQVPGGFTAPFPPTNSTTERQVSKLIIDSSEYHFPRLWSQAF